MHLLAANIMLTSGTKDAPKNPVLEARLVVRRAELAKAKNVAKDEEVSTKPLKSGEPYNSRVTPTCQSKRGTKGTMVVDTSKNIRSTLHCKATSWVPSLKPDKGNLIPASTFVFGDHVLASYLNRVMVLLNDYDTCKALDKKQHLKRLDRAHHKVISLAH